ncbi:DUF438 domain-containing protein [Tissierella sp. Yu-01]|uniref:DUF438 domain-containing protein n=1 Tax=Tissierella sp. Yu-01 TaxID=3035694 RepID=UPI00240D10D5|nr:DUF438 domain-containing protein [Tissierella sp. Yu-01]WFA08118.1 DUF438 domain-containing protein [Tissierella sp. Yu-01]
MSELINNREHRQEILKEVIRELHAGKSVEEVKEKFAAVIEGVSPLEISQMEVALVKEGLPIEEIQHLCNVHAEVFKGTLEEIHHPEQVPGHPVHTFKRENEALNKLMDEDIKKALDDFKAEDSQENIIKLIENINLLWDIDKHYSRKENLIFPYLEKYEITSPPKVMWGVDDDIRAMIKDAKLSLTNYQGNKDEVVKKIEDAAKEVKEMIFKEESILFPMALETLTEDEWISIYMDSDEIGYTLVAPEKSWELKRVNLEKKEEKQGLTEGGFIKFETGILSTKELNLILNNIPGDFTFVDKDNIVKYFSNSKDRIFARTKAVIGRTVENCHPPASVNVVENLVNDFKSGKKDSESFWINKGDLFVLIQYFAIRDENGEFIGTLEFSQEVSHIRALTGEKRLVEEA